MPHRPMFYCLPLIFFSRLLSFLVGAYSCLLTPLYAKFSLRVPSTAQVVSFSLELYELSAFPYCFLLRIFLISYSNPALLKVLFPPFHVFQPSPLSRPQYFDLFPLTPLVVLISRPNPCVVVLGPFRKWPTFSAGPCPCSLLVEAFLLDECR